MLTRRRSARLQEDAAEEEPTVEEEKDSPKTAARKRAAKTASSSEPPKTRARGAAKTAPNTPKPKTLKGNNKKKSNVKAKEEEEEQDGDQEDMEVDGEEPEIDKSLDLTDTVSTPTTASAKKRSSKKARVAKGKTTNKEPEEEEVEKESGQISYNDAAAPEAEDVEDRMDTDSQEKSEENGKEEDSDASEDDSPKSRPITPSQRKNPVRSSAAKASYKEKDESSGDSDMTSSDSESTFRDSEEDVPKKKSPASAKNRHRRSPSPSTSDDEEEEEEEESDLGGDEDDEEEKSTKKGKRTGGKKTSKAKGAGSRRNSGGCNAIVPKTTAGGRKGMVKPWESQTISTSVGNVIMPPPPMRKVELFMAAFKVIAGKLAEGRNREIGVDELGEFTDKFVELRKEYKKDKMAFVRRILEGREKPTEEEEERVETKVVERDDDDDDDGSSSEDEWMEMEPVVDEGKKVQITVGGKPVDDAIQKGAEFIRQEVNKCIRQKWEDGHKVHLLCYIAHLQYTVKVVLHEMTVPYLITSQLPEGLSALQGEPISLAMAKKIGIWYKSNFKAATDIITVSEEALHDTRYPETARYAVLAEKKTYETDYERATLLFALLVGLDAIARICINTRPIPRRWDAATLAKLSSPKGSGASKKEKSKGKKKEQFKEEMDYWVEYWNSKEKRWICIDPATGTVDDAVEIEKNTHSPIHYVFAIDNKRGVRDVSARYASDFLKPDFRRRRTDEAWLMRTLRKPLLKADVNRATLEDTHFRTEMVGRPLPTSLAEYKNHPLYVLEKDLLKYESIYPPPSEQKELGEVKGHKVYPRDTVHCLQGALNWIKLARSVKEGEKAYKVVKARLNPRIPAEGQEKFLEVFGFWQTEPYRKEKVEHGKIPRNKYGNVYMYQPTMCPIGATYLRLPGLPTIARRLHKECVPAVIGWEFSGSANHPIIEGACVLEEDVDEFVAEWKKAEARREEREAKRREERIYANWKKLITGIVRLHRVHAKFGSVPKKTKKVKKGEVKKEEEPSGIIDMTEQPKTRDMALHDVMGFK